MGSLLVALFFIMFAIVLVLAADHWAVWMSRGIDGLLWLWGRLMGALRGR